MDEIVGEREWVSKTERERDRERKEKRKREREREREWWTERDGKKYTINSVRDEKRRKCSRVDLVGSVASAIVMMGRCWRRWR